MKKLFIGVLFVSVMVILIFWTMSGNTKRIAQTVTVVTGTIHEDAVAVGKISPKHSITVKSPLSGIVESISHELGDYVKMGDVLLQIKPNPTPKEYAQAVSLVKENEADVINLAQRVKNYEYLLENKIIKENYSEYVAAKSELARNEALLQFDQQSLDLMTKGTATIEGKTIKSAIVSPVDGYILKRGVDVGDMVISTDSSQAATELFTIANMNDLEFKGSVDEIDAGRLSLGMPAMIEIAAMPNTMIAGKLTQLSLQSQKQDSTDSPFNVGFEVEVSQLVLPEGINLRSGYSATASIILKTAENVLILPEGSILYSEDKTYVQLPSANGKAPTLQRVETGLSDGIHIEIKSGLSVGDAVLRNPMREPTNEK